MQGARGSAGMVLTKVDQNILLKPLNSIFGNVLNREVKESAKYIFNYLEKIQHPQSK